MAQRRSGPLLPAAACAVAGRRPVGLGHASPGAGRVLTQLDSFWFLTLRWLASAGALLIEGVRAPTGLEHCGPARLRKP